ncbi:YesL family protein [Halalkalibacterium halodurans]|uniref:BH0787 protein n=1 Tax=Halalkalibacterium halodurans (strain ATCC BAA-125 / DSM 18197 / FERM 7344 / JCM 9153 / C-125) TaxID=272558 RepID=Q9KER2_HALH5|nr:YesL family protein [Halalkalibacterium halodurans]MED4081439.1 YesL family protein [Halalkalibacterium halodurans]MED4083279.1 YesL family protein [Halalkalibacterium halodurans]MED4106530.1 YesL family protein [Halalkalibacterium halodurans]MED4108765.1 YesL family protein [Halalkalibacterium halodurans]MED4122674.1 YesL family protein [Halalkalibacterium halodurans]
MVNRLGGLFTEASFWIWRMMQLNWAWLAHILLGGVVFGLFPATGALFATTRRWLHGELDLPIWKSFHTFYKLNFWKMNGIGSVYLFLGALLVFDLYLVTQLKGIIALISTIVIITCLVIYVFSFFYMFSYYVHFEQTVKQYLWQPFIITLISLKQNILIGLGLTVIGYLLYQMPGLIPFVLGTLPAFWVMKVALNRFRQFRVNE